MLVKSSRERWKIDVEWERLNMEQLKIEVENKTRADLKKQRVEWEI